MGSGGKSEFQLYYEYIQKHFRRAWKRDENVPGRVRITFNIDVDGHVRDVVLREPSGDPELDAKALDLVATASPFKPLPESLKPLKLLPVDYMF